MNINNYKRDFKFRSDEGNNKGVNWIIILCAVAVVAVAYFFI
jgi:hypothetical protein